jgi:tetratricopeptide (TPR) repeat protein
VVTDPDVAALIEKLDGLPLALATTGAYLKNANVSVATYLRLYASSWAQLHEGDAGIESYEDRTLYSTWNISLEHIRQQNELSAKLLSLWCYFGNRDLWFELLCDGNAEGLPWIRDLTVSLPAFIDAMRLLCNYSLAEMDTSWASNHESGGYSIHACVHSWTIHALNKHLDKALAKFAITAVGQHVPGQTAEEPWITQRRLIPHAERCSQYVLEVDETQINVGDCLHNIADLLSDYGKMQGAEEMYLRTLQGYETAWGASHMSTLNTVNNLGLLYSDLGRMQEAEEMLLRALRGYEAAWGAEHTSTLNTVNNLGHLYSDLGRMQEAEQMFEQALKGYQNAEGDHQAVIKYLQAQLQSSKLNGQLLTNNPERRLHDLIPQGSTDCGSQSDRTARMREYAMHILTKL